ncbi:hypothetical protein B14911_18455 [Bacillus sp. NRRL B-14911]|nr:hypothetical protein B14911_18455 [Bacillus sp. NRRL B-14911]
MGGNIVVVQKLLPGSFFQLIKVNISTLEKRM